LRARRRMFAIVTSALTGALVLAAPAAGTAEPTTADEPSKNQLSTQDVPAAAATALEETSDLFGNLGRNLGEALSTGASLSTDLGTTADTPADAPADAPVDSPANRPSNGPANRPATPPAYSPAYSPASSPANRPSNITVDVNEEGSEELAQNDIGSSLDEASQLPRLVGRTAASLVNGVDDVIGSID
jgi:hypothetical protein